MASPADGGAGRVRLHQLRERPMIDEPRSRARRSKSTSRATFAHGPRIQSENGTGKPILGR